MQCYIVIVNPDSLRPYHILLQALPVLRSWRHHCSQAKPASPVPTGDGAHVPAGMLPCRL